MTPRPLYNSVIVPFDGSAEALRASRLAGDLTERFGSRLHIVTASGAPSSGALEQLKSHAVRLSSERVDVWIDAGAEPARAVSAAAEHRLGSLVCMATHARTGMRRALFGSVAEKVLHHVDAPVLLVGPNCEAGGAADLRQIIVCLDGSTTSEAAVPLAAAWANALDLRCLLLSVLDGNKKTAAPNLHRFRATLEGFCKVETLEYETVDTVEGIAAVATYGAGSVLAMATHGRTGLDRLAHGSVVASVAARSPIPVLVQRGNETFGLDWLRDHGAAAR